MTTEGKILSKDNYHGVNVVKYGFIWLLNNGDQNQGKYGKIRVTMAN